MALSQEYLDFITEMLEPLGVLSVRRMFGGALVKIDDVQLGVIINEELYFRLTTDTLKARFTAEGSAPFSYTRKDKKDPVTIKKWWKVPEQYLDDPLELQSLAELVLQQ